MQKLLIIFTFLSLTIQAGKPSWKTFALHIEGAQTAADSEQINKAILKCDPKMIKEVKGTAHKDGYVLIHHDHHNTTFQKIGQAILKIKKVKVYTKLHIPDYQKVQGSILGKKLNEILQSTGKGYLIKTIDEQKGIFEVIIQKGKYSGKGFNFGGLAHAISDPVVFGGLGLNLCFIGGGSDGKLGQVYKDVVVKELRFRKMGKKQKPFDQEIMAAHKKLFNFPPEKLAKFYQ